MAVYGAGTDTIDIFGQNYLSVAVGDVICADYDTEVVISVKDADGDAYAGYDGNTVSIMCFDVDNSYATVEVKTTGAYGTTVEGVITGSSLTMSNIEFDCSGQFDHQLVVTAEVLSGAASIIPKVYGNDSATAGKKTLVWTVEPSSVTRSTNFSMTVQGQDGKGNVLTAAADAITLTLVGADANDVFNSSSAVVISGNLSSGEWTTATEQIVDGVGYETGVTVVAADVAGDFVADTAAEFTIGTLYKLDPESYSAGYSHSADQDNNAAGWELAWNLAHDPVSDAMPGGASWDSIEMYVSLYHAVVLYSGSAIAAIRRSYAIYDISAQKGAAGLAELYVPTTLLTFNGWALESWPSEAADVSIQIYTNNSSLISGTAYEKFNDVLTKAQAGTIISSTTFAALKTQHDASGNTFVKFAIGADAVNNAPDDYLRLFFVTNRDYSDSFYSYPGDSVEYQKPHCYLREDSADDIPPELWVTA